MVLMHTLLFLQDESARSFHILSASQGLLLCMVCTSTTTTTILCCTSWHTKQTVKGSLLGLFCI